MLGRNKHHIDLMGHDFANGLWWFDTKGFMALTFYNPNCICVETGWITFSLYQTFRTKKGD
ncbi:hypothetical protein C0081_20840 [Cohaesibacter celericrescens]|uniref:Uncharacterized protein n=1 Tax=Cohaesibacter celericrescens TaxID=2067669 RepID=A0A2N5XL96_9HYPH|nr:hypothetical protein C0081_20840 [Cohaesibacter celericrescens]